MATLEGKKIVIIGGSSGMGYAVAKGSLLSLAEHVLVASSSRAKVDAAVARLLAEPALQARSLSLAGRVSGDVVDLKDALGIAVFFERIGEIDHLVITGGSVNPTVDFRNVDLSKYKDAFDLRFWGSAVAAQKAKIRSGGSITFTAGIALLKPPPTLSLIVGAIGAVDALARSLAIELSPLRVNVVSPGLVETELWDTFAPDTKDKTLADLAAKLPVKHVARPEEIAEAYLFLMKCSYITGQRIQVDGGDVLV